MDATTLLRRVNPHEHRAHPPTWTAIREMHPHNSHPADLCAVRQRTHIGCCFAFQGCCNHGLSSSRSGDRLPRRSSKHLPRNTTSSSVVRKRNSLPVSTSSIQPLKPPPAGLLSLL